MRDPNNIDLQSVDPDLSVNQEPLTGGDGGAGDLMDYASTVGQWGTDATDYFSLEPQAPPTKRKANPNCPPSSYFHPRHRLNTPFLIAGVLAIIVIVIVFVPVPTGG